ncbi:MAG: 30S ribosomal protein S12 methylthiotransferase RimO [Candidatus Dadabacteria bacterium]|nr:MAG: 30S ribosomal protein S12 methylthiotransferase RimO [Candidatus Dadabacteria bacterium]
MRFGAVSVTMSCMKEAAPPRDERPRVFVVSLGCAKAQVDAEAALGQMVDAGYEIVDQIEDATTVVVNTCGFIEPAIRESVDTIVEAAELREDGAIQELIVAGCLVDRHGAELAEELPEVDHFVGSGAFREWARVRRQPQRILASPGPALPSSSDRRVLLNASHYAWVKIAEGCDRQCAFCTIPSIRGKQRSRTADDIVQELSGLAGQGVREALLVSQDTVRWGLDLTPRRRLHELLARIDHESELPDWIRVHYLYPERLPDELISLLAAGERIVPYVDVPIQHGSDRILELMRRAHRRDDIRRLVDRLREVNPDVSIRTTVIVGHPGETPADVDALCELIQELRFDAVGIFTWWNEAGTVSSTLPDHVDPGEQHERANVVEDTARDAAEAAASRWVGRSLRVLVDGPDPFDPDAWIGRHAGQAPDIDGVVRLPGHRGPAGAFVDVRIAACDGHDLIAERSAGIPLVTTS